MAIGDTVRAGLMRVDPSAILEVGRVKGQLGQQVGQTLGGLATTYFDTKKRAKESEGQIKGVSMALKTLAKADDGFADLYEAQDARINDPEIPLSQRRAEALSFMQNLGVTQKVRSAQIADQATLANLQLQRDKAISDKALNAILLESKKIGLQNDLMDLLNKNAEFQALPPTDRANILKNLEKQKEEKSRLDIVGQKLGIEGQKLGIEGQKIGIRRDEVGEIRDEIAIGQDIATLEGTKLGNKLKREELNRNEALAKLSDPSSQVTEDFTDAYTFDFSEDSDDFYGSPEGVLSRSVATVSKYTPDVLPFMDPGETQEQKVSAAESKINSFNLPLRSLLTKEIAGRTTNLQLGLVDQNLFKIGDSAIQASNKAENLLSDIKIRKQQLKTMLPRFIAQKQISDANEVKQDLMALDRIEKSLSKSLGSKNEISDEDAQILRENIGR
jgi:hypothetical protein